MNKFLLSLLCCLLSSCIFHTGKCLYLHGQEGTCLLTDSVQLWKAGDKVYVEAVRAPFRLRESSMMSSINDASDTEYYIAPGTPRTRVYGEVELHHDCCKDCGHSWKRKNTPWLSEKPVGAVKFRHYRPARKARLHLMKGEEALADEAPHATARALYAYPLAAVCLAGFDIPVTIATNTGMFVGGLIVMPFYMLFTEYSTPATEWHSARP